MDSQSDGPSATDQEQDGWEWAVVEIMGHRKHAGRTREVERFGAKFVRVDVPNKGDPAEHGWTTHFYGGAAIFSFTLAEEAACLRANKPYEAAGRLPYLPPEDDTDFDEV